MRHVVIFCIFGLLAGGFYFLAETPTFLQFEANSFGEIAAYVHKAEDLEPLPERVLFAGDTMLARDVERLMGQYGSTYPYRNLADVFGEHTYQVANFEASIPEQHTPTKDLTFQFSVDATNVSAIKDVGFTHVSLANNHALDFGNEGYANTIEVLEGNNIATFGKPYALATSSITHMYVDDTVVALIGLDLTLSTYSDEALQLLFNRAKDTSAFQIVFIHWGNEYQLSHSDQQERYARKFIEHGADLIIGHHPHVVQDIQKYDGVLVFYSLGNFIFDQYFSQEVQEGLLLSLSLDVNPSIKLLPVSSVGSRISPRLMDGFEERTFLDALAKRSASTLKEEITAGHIEL